MDFQAALTATGWTDRYVATQLGCAPPLIAYWRTRAGQGGIPSEVIDWLEASARAIQANPPPAPERWRRRRGFTLEELHPGMPSTPARFDSRVVTVPVTPEETQDISPGRLVQDMHDVAARFPDLMLDGFVSTQGNAPHGREEMLTERSLDRFRTLRAWLRRMPRRASSLNRKALTYWVLRRAALVLDDPDLPEGLLIAAAAAEGFRVGRWDPHSRSAQLNLSTHAVRALVPVLKGGGAAPLTSTSVPAEPDFPAAPWSPEDFPCLP